MKYAGEKQISARRQKNPHERIQIRRRNHAAFLLGTGPMLNQSAHRHDKESSEETKQREMNRGRQHRLPGAVQKRAEHSHAHGAKRNQSILDFSAGKISRRHAADPDSQRHRRLQISNVFVVHSQHIVPKNNDRELQQRREKKKIRIAENGPREHAVGSNNLGLAPEIAESIPAKSPTRVSRGNPRDAKARRQPRKRRAK